MGSAWEPTVLVLREYELNEVGVVDVREGSSWSRATVLCARREIENVVGLEDLGGLSGRWLNQC